MKILNKLLLFSLIALAALGCEDNSKYPLPVTEDGAFITVDITNGLIDVTQIDVSAFSGTLIDPRSNIKSHTFKVRSVFNGIASDYEDVYSTTNFPANFAITAGDIAGVLGVDVSSFEPGTKFEFTGTSIKNDDTVITFNNINADLQAEIGQKQSYKLETFISCPFIRADAVGTWIITNDPFDAAILSDLGQDETFEVVAGPGANQVTFIDVFGHARFNGITTPGKYDIVVDVDPDTGIATVASKFDDVFQFAWDSANFGLTFGDIYLEQGDGFLFSCAGQFTISWRHTLQDGRSYGFQAFSASKL